MFYLVLTSGLDRGRVDVTWNGVQESHVGGRRGANFFPGGRDEKLDAAIESRRRRRCSCIV